MEKVWFFFKVLPFLGVLYWGVYAILAVVFPSLRPRDFNRWEIDDSEGAYIEIAAWRKVLTPPHVLAQGYMSNRAACTLAVVGGVILILVGTFGIRHVCGVPGFLPDAFGGF